MADPLSLAGLALQVAALLKQLYDYSKDAKGAQKEMFSLYGELSALQSILQTQSKYGLEGDSNIDSSEYQKMLLLTQNLLDDIQNRVTLKATPTKRALQSMKWPFDAAEIREKFSNLERLKAWLLLAITIDNRSRSNALMIEMTTLAEAVRASLTSNERRHSIDTDQSLLREIAPVSPEVPHSKACRTWEGTDSGLWFCNGVLSDWLLNSSTDSRIMVLTGRSGAGKTTLMSRAVEFARQVAQDVPDLHFAYFYCAYNDLGSQSVKNILGSWVAQIPRAVEKIQKIYQEREGSEKIYAADLESSLLEIDEMANVVLYLDAINECSEARTLAELLVRLTSQVSTIKVIVSVTPHFQDLQDVLNDSYRRIDLTPETVTPDIETYISTRILNHAVLSQVPKAEVMNALLPRAEGMFRWVDCQMRYLEGQLTPRLVRRALNQLPGTLNDTYVLLLARISEGQKSTAKNALLWLSFCHRPLNLEELSEAVIIEDDDDMIDDTCRLQAQDQERLLSMCQGLAVHDASTGSVTLAHSSIKTFLTGHYIRSTSVAYFALDADESPRYLVRKCLTYLSLSPFRSGPNYKRELRKPFSQYPLLEYVSTRWAIHARVCELTKTELDIIKAFFLTQRTQKNGGSFLFWVWCLTPFEPLSVRVAEPLYYSASFGLTPVVRMLLSEGLVGDRKSTSQWYINHKCGRAFSTALQVASTRGRSDVVDVLLQAGADPNLTDRFNHSSLYYATQNGHREIVKRLLNRGASTEGVSRQQLNIALGNDRASGGEV